MINQNTPKTADNRIGHTSAKSARRDFLYYSAAGAGVVADSKPEKEYAETVNKAKALMRAVD